jgi:NADH-quinone oxidoreductase subunit J
MTVLFYIAGSIAILATFMVIGGRNPIHALLYFIVSLLSVALIFYLLGAPFAAALEVIIYAGAIMVLFLFVVMMLNQGRESPRLEGDWLSPAAWVGPSLLTAVLFAEMAYILTFVTTHPPGGEEVAPKQVGIALFGPYILGVEAASMLLLAGLAGAYHLGRRREPRQEEEP